MGIRWRVDWYMDGETLPYVTETNEWEDAFDIFIKAVAEEMYNDNIKFAKRAIERFAISRGHCTVDDLKKYGIVECLSYSEIKDEDAFPNVRMYSYVVSGNEQSKVNTFNSLKDAINYGVWKFSSDYDSELVIVNGKKTLLCSTPLALEEEIYARIEQIYSEVAEIMNVELNSLAKDLISLTTTQMIDDIESAFHMKVVYVFEEY